MCAAAGGVGVIIYNNVPGPFTGTLQSCPSGSTIPSFSLAQELAGQFADGSMVTGAVGPNTMYAYYDGWVTGHGRAAVALLGNHIASGWHHARAAVQCCGQLAAVMLYNVPPRKPVTPASAAGAVCGAGPPWRPPTPLLLQPWCGASGQHAAMPSSAVPCAALLWIWVMPAGTTHTASASSVLRRLWTAWQAAAIATEAAWLQDNRMA